MKRRTKAVLLIGGLAVATAFATVAVLTEALARVTDPRHHCDTGFSRLITCRVHWTSTTIRQSSPIFTTPSNTTTTTPSGTRDTSRPIYVDVMSWGVADCPSNYIARRLLCGTSDAAPAQAADDDPVTGLPRPKPWLVTTAKDSTFIKAFHVETPVDLAGALRFYRLELGKRSWSENSGAIVEPGRAVITFTTADGPALLRLTRQDDRTIIDLSLRKPPATNAGLKPMPGQVRLLFGNTTDEEAVITINDQTIELAAGRKLPDDPATGRKSPDGQEINLPPGKYRVSLKIASRTAQNREFEVAADETWGLLVGPAGVALPVHLY